jgi:hypothetical protein
VAFFRQLIIYKIPFLRHGAGCYTLCFDFFLSKGQEGLSLWTETAYWAGVGAPVYKGFFTERKVQSVASTVVIPDAILNQSEPFHE